MAHTLTNVTSLSNLLAAWREFESGKRNKPDVQYFARNLFDNLLSLQQDVRLGQYQHGPYERFVVSDPKTRIIHKASVRDRVLHRAIYRLLYPFFDKTFISDSYSCRKDKGTHKALNRFIVLARKVGHNHNRTVWVLKADIRKFFASIDQDVLINNLKDYVSDDALMQLLRTVIRSFKTEKSRGLPLGNLTSQLFCNIYMNSFDQYVKHKLRVPHYIRYADDFALISHDRDWLMDQIEPMQKYLRKELKLEMHPDKLWIKTFASGVDFLGWVHFPHHRVLRSSTRKRAQRAMSTANDQALQSYLGLLQHGNTRKLHEDLRNSYWFEQKHNY